MSSANDSCVVMGHLQSPEAVPLSVFILNLPFPCTESDLRHEFSEFGTVTRVVLLQSELPYDRKYSSIPAFLCFTSSSEAVSAKAYMDRNLFHGVQLKTCWGDPNETLIRVQIPEEFELIDKVANHMVEVGEEGSVELETHLRIHPNFKFLLNRDSPQYTYLKWRIVTLLCPDLTYRAFRLLPHGPLWIPPSESIFDKKLRFSLGAQPLKPSDIDTLTTLLKTINSTRNCVSAVMVFCIDRSDCSHQIVDLIMSIDPLIFDGQIGRLYLISDLLFNAACNKKSAWSFRSAIESFLPSYFAHMHSLAQQSERLRERVARVLSVWCKWKMFTSQFIDGLSLVWGDLRIHGHYSSTDLEPIVLIDDEEVLKTEMKNFGLVVANDGNDAARFHKYLHDVYGMYDDVDGVSLTSSDLEDIDGTPVDGTGRQAGWTSVSSSPLSQPPKNSEGGRFKFSLEQKGGVPVSSVVRMQPIVSVKTVVRADIGELFIDVNPPGEKEKKRSQPSTRSDDVVPRKYRGFR